MSGVDQWMSLVSMMSLATFSFEHETAEGGAIVTSNSIELEQSQRKMIYLCLFNIDDTTKAKTRDESQWNPVG